MEKRNNTTLVQTCITFRGKDASDIMDAFISTFADKNGKLDLSRICPVPDELKKQPWRPKCFTTRAGRNKLNTLLAKEELLAYAKANDKTTAAWVERQLSRYDKALRLYTPSAEENEHLEEYMELMRKYGVTNTKDWYFGALSTDTPCVEYKMDRTAFQIRFLTDTFSPLGFFQKLSRKNPFKTADIQVMYAGKEIGVDCGSYRLRRADNRELYGMEEEDRSTRAYGIWQECWQAE